MTNATEFRNILANLPDRPGETVEYHLLTEFAAAGTEGFPKKIYIQTLSAGGTGTQALPVPTTGAWLWQVRLPDGQVPRATLAAGADLQLTTWLASAQSTVTAASLADQFAGLANFDAHVADTTAVHGIADTSLLETVSGAQAKADAVAGDLTDHEVATGTAVHGLGSASVQPASAFDPAGSAAAAEAAANAAAVANLASHAAEVSTHGFVGVQAAPFSTVELDAIGKWGFCTSGPQLQANIGGVIQAFSPVSPYPSKAIYQSPVAYYRINDLVGAVAMDSSGNGYHGTYSNVTLANTPGPFDGLAPLFGTAGVVNMDASAAAAAISGSEGAVVVAIKVPSANWTDGATRGVLYIAGGSDFIWLIKEAANGTFTWRRTAGGTNQIRSKASISETGWIIIGLDWSESGNQVIAYYNGHQEGAAMAASAWGATAPNVISVGAIGLAGSSEWNAWAAEVAFFAAPLGAAGHETLADKYF